MGDSSGDFSVSDGYGTSCVTWAPLNSKKPIMEPQIKLINCIASQKSVVTSSQSSYICINIAEWDSSVDGQGPWLYACV